MRFKIFTPLLIIAFFGISNLCFAQDIILKTSNVETGFRFQLQTFQNNVTVSVDWGDGLGIVNMGDVAGAAKYFNAPTGLSGNKTIKIYTDDKVEFFGFSVYQLDEFSVATTNNSLKEISINECNLNVLNIGEATNIEGVTCNNNNLISLTIAVNANLKGLDLASNKLLTTVTLPATLESLTSLKMSNTSMGNSVQSILNIAPILTSFVMDNDLVTTKVSSVDLSKNPLLEVISLMHNSLTGSMNLSSHSKLTSVNVSYNTLTGLSLNAPKLITLTGVNNQFSAIAGIANSPFLETVNLSTNNFATIDLSTNSNIKNIFMLDNVLTELNLSPELNNLGIINLKNNKLKSLNLNENALVISSLDLANNMFIFSTLPKVKTTINSNYVFRPQADSLFLKVEADKISIDVKDYIGEKISGTVPGISHSPTLLAGWHGIKANGSATILKLATHYTLEGSVYTFKMDELTKISCESVRAAFTNKAFTSLTLYSNVLKLNDSTVGIGTENQDTRVVYLNPVTQELNYNVEGAKNLSIFNLLGQTVYSRTLDADKDAINIDELANGTYIVRIVDNKKASITKKIVKK